MADNDLAVRALNYHGQQLTNFVKDDPLFRELDLSGVDYRLYHKRSKEIRLEDRERRTALHRFIASNMSRLFQRNDDDDEGKATGCDGDAAAAGADRNFKNLESAVLPPYETFALDKISKEQRTKRAFELLEVGDVLFAKVTAYNSSGLLLILCGFVSLNLRKEGGHRRPKSRHLKDLKIKCFCPVDETPQQDSSCQRDDYVRVVVLEVKRDVQRLLVGMRTDSMRDPKAAKRRVEEFGEGAKLGVVPEGASGLPQVYGYSAHVEEKGITYGKMLKSSVGFHNPTNVQVLERELGLSGTAGESSLMRFVGGYEEGSYAKALRQRQSANAAFRHVEVGVKHFKAGESVEAFQCLNMALKLDPENVEGLVARGALYANSGSLEKAVADFGNALRVKPSHKNANKYLAETQVAVAKRLKGQGKAMEAREAYVNILARDPNNLEARKEFCDALVADARQQEREGKIEEAIATFHKILSIDPDNRTALDSIWYLKERPKALHQAGEGGSWEALSKIHSLLLQKEDDEGGKSSSSKKRRRKSRGSSSSSSNSSQSSSGSSDSERRRRRKRKRKKSRKEKSKPDVDKFGQNLQMAATATTTTTTMMLAHPTMGAIHQPSFDASGAGYNAYMTKPPPPPPTQFAATSAGYGLLVATQPTTEAIRKDVTPPPPGEETRAGGSGLKIRPPGELMGEKSVDCAVNIAQTIPSTAYPPLVLTGPPMPIVGMPPPHPIYMQPPPVIAYPPPMKSEAEKRYDKQVERFLAKTNSSEPPRRDRFRDRDRAPRSPDRNREPAMFNRWPRADRERSLAKQREYERRHFRSRRESERHRESRHESRREPEKDEVKEGKPPESKSELEDLLNLKMDDIDEKLNKHFADSKSSRGKEKSSGEREKSSGEREKGSKESKRKFTEDSNESRDRSKRRSKERSSRSSRERSSRSSKERSRDSNERKDRKERERTPPKPKPKTKDWKRVPMNNKLWMPMGSDSFLNFAEETDKKRVVSYVTSPSPVGHWAPVEYDSVTGMYKRTEGEQRVVRQISKSPPRRRRSRSRSRSRGRSDRKRRRSRSPEKKSESLKDMMMDLDHIREERERIEREKANILRQQQDIMYSLPAPVSSSLNSSNGDNEGIMMRLEKKTIGERWVDEDTDEDDQDEQQGLESALNSVLDAVKPGKTDPRAEKIIPGASSFDDIEKYLTAAKKEKMEKLRKANKDVRSSTRR